MIRRRLVFVAFRPLAKAQLSIERKKNVANRSHIAAYVFLLEPTKQQCDWKYILWDIVGGCCSLREG